MENRDLSSSKEINHLIIIAESILFYIETEIGLSDSSLIVSLSGINYIVVIYNPLAILGAFI